MNPTGTILENRKRKSRLCLLFFLSIVFIGINSLRAADPRSSFTERFRLPLLTNQATVARVLNTSKVVNLRPDALPSIVTNTASLRVFTRVGAGWLRSTSQVSRAGNEVSVTVPQAISSLVFEPLTSKTLLTSNSAFAIPFVPISATAGAPRKMTVVPRVQPSPAAWNQARKQFETVLQVAIVPVDPQVRGAIPADYRSLTLEATGADVEPSALELTEYRKFASARLTFKNNDTRPSIDVFPFTDQAPLLVPVRTLGGILLSAAKENISGAGLEEVTLTVSRVDADRRPLAEGPDLPITLSAQYASVPEKLFIPAGAATTNFVIRSAGIQTDKITARAEPFGDTKSIAYIVPKFMLGAVFVGGLLGSAARWLARQKATLQQGMRFLAEGCVAATILTVAAYFGITATTLPASMKGSEAWIFLISAATSYVGIKTLNWLPKIVPAFGGREKP